MTSQRFDGRSGRPADAIDASPRFRNRLPRSGAAVALITCLCAPVAMAQVGSIDDQPAPERRLLADTAPGRHTGAIMIGTSVALAVYGKRKWWQDGFRSRFTAVDEGWFGQDTYSGGADKLGHFYMTYASSRLLTRAFVWDGASHEKSLQIAAWYTLGAYTAIEVLDGFSRKWSFSREDVLMNAAGVGAGVLLESHPGLDRMLDLRVLYRPAREEGRSFDPFGDYSGQTYLIVAKLAGFPGLRPTGLLRYVEVAAGYGTRGYESGSGRHSRRNVYVGLSLNLSELIGGAPAGEEGRARRFAKTALEYVQIPGTAVLARKTLQPGPRAPGQ